jgi:hypothetical protein
MRPGLCELVGVVGTSFLGQRALLATRLGRNSCIVFVLGRGMTSREKGWIRRLLSLGASCALVVVVSSGANRNAEVLCSDLHLVLCPSNCVRILQIHTG